MHTIAANKFGNVINIFVDGNQYQKSFDTKEEADNFFQLVIVAKNGSENAFQEFMTILNKANRAYYKGILEIDSANNYYLKGFSIPIPTVLAETLINYLDNNYPVDALVNFWKLLMANPDKQVREDLFDFLKLYNFAITDNGYFTAYKAVAYTNKIANNFDLADYVSKEYLRIRKLKKGTSNFYVVKDGSKYLTVNESESKKATNILGTVKYLHENLEPITSENTYTDKWTRKMSINLGVPVQEERSLCDANPYHACSNGLHAGTSAYARNYAASEDVILLVLINPAHVVAVPKSDTSKLRASEYFPCQIMKKANDKTFVTLEGSYFENDYRSYEIDQIESLLREINSKPVNSLTLEQKDYQKILNSRFADLTTKSFEEEE